MPRPRNATYYFGDSLYDLLPEYWREEDHTPVCVAPEAGGVLEELLFHQRFMRAMATGTDSILTAVNALLDWWDPLRCPLEELPRLAMNFGWPLDTSVSETTQRLLVRHVVELVYKRKGNIGGMRRAVYALTGLPCLFKTNFSGVGIFAYRPRAAIYSITPCGPGTSPGSAADGTRIEFDPAVSVEPEIGRQIAIVSESGRELVIVADLDAGVIWLDRALRFIHPMGAQIAVLHDSERLADVGGYGAGVRYGAGMKPSVFRYTGSVEAGDCYGGGKGYADGACPDPGTETDNRRRLTFTVKFFSTPSVLQLRVARRIIDYMKPARAHYRFVHDDGIQPLGLFVYGQTAYGTGAVYQE